MGIRFAAGAFLKWRPDDQLPWMLPPFDKIRDSGVAPEWVKKERRVRKERRLNVLGSGTDAALSVKTSPLSEVARILEHSATCVNHIVSDLVEG
jgi:hypothetical protein